MQIVHQSEVLLGMPMKNQIKVADLRSCSEELAIAVA